ASCARSQQNRLVDNQPKKTTVTVPAADGTTQQSYTVAATGHPRADLRDLTLSPGELNPSIFVTVQQDYRAWTPHSVKSVRVTATRRHGVETLTVNGQAVTSGQASPAIALEVGENRITVVATAPDGYTSKSYTITVTRLTEAQSSDATLSAIKVYQATDFQPDSANNVPYEGDPLTIAPAVSRTEREYRAEQPEADGIYVAVAVTTNAPGARSIVIDGPDVNLERRDPKDEVVSGEASGPWQMSIGYQLITIRVTSLDGKNTETYRLVIKRGTVDDLKGLSLSSGDGALTLSWDASDPSPTAPTEYMLRWRKAGETAWLNRGFPPGWKTSYALDAGYAGPADGDRYMSVSDGSATVSGLDNGVAYEVQARGARGTLEPRTGERKVFVFLRTDWQGLTGTPGAAQTTLSITPTSPSRQYGETDDLGYTVSGLKSGDAATDVLTGALSRASGEDAGDYAIGMGTLAVPSAHAGKYALPAAPAVTTYTITPKPITAISGVRVNARASDGTTDATFDTSAANGTGVLSAELA
ncbi:MAG: cadherin-like beta sandwich domain-containing protein, partial [Chloroflexi bacterium]|nr:cadherin-like beta sandwich domain-containing protein [Chloroflexota bacterium]